MSADKESLRVQQLKRRITELEDRIQQFEEIFGQLSAQRARFKFTYFTATEEKYLGLLWSRKGVVVPKFAIFNLIYGGLPDGDQPEDPKIIDVVVCHIRKKLKPFGVEISTMWGRGFYFDDENRAKLAVLIKDESICSDGVITTEEAARALASMSL